MLEEEEEISGSCDPAKHFQPSIRIGADSERADFSGKELMISGKSRGMERTWTSIYGLQVFF